MKPLVKVLGAGLVAAGIGVVVGQQLAPKPNPIPAEPFDKLQYGNELFAKGKLLPPKVDEMTRYQLETEGQRPFAVVVACSDSRVPPELIFNQGLGNLFVVRTAGNIVNKENLASIEYAVEHLKASLIVVLGHTHCEIIEVAVSGKPLEGHLPSVVAHIEPVIRQLRQTHPHLKGDALKKRVTHEHVRYTMRGILERSALVRKHFEAGKVHFAGGVYHLREGKVEWLKLPEEIESSKHEENSDKESLHAGH